MWMYIEYGDAVASLRLCDSIFCEVHKHKYGIKFRRWCEVRILQNKISHQHIFVTAIFIYYPMLCSLESLKCMQRKHGKIPKKRNLESSIWMDDSIRHITVLKFFIFALNHVR